MKSDLFDKHKTRENGSIFVYQPEYNLHKVDKQIILFMQIFSLFQNQNYGLRIPFMVSQ